MTRSITRFPSRRGHFAAAAASVAALVLVTACGGGGGDEGDDGDGESASSITFWTPHTTPARLAGQEAVAAAFTDETGIEVEVVPLAGADQNQSLVTGAASGDVPDVILHSQDQTAAWNSQGLLDTEVPQQVVDTLGPETFAEQAIDLVTHDDILAAVPSDGWGHVIVYRTDLLEQAQLDPPETIQDVAEIATAMHATGITGMALGTQPGDPFTTESLESVLIPAGCELVTDGEITFDSPECAEGLELFNQLAESSTAGQFNVESARASYLAGQSAMLLFSSHILDELAGVDPPHPANCPQCAADPAFLAANSGFVTVLNEDAGQYGATYNYGVPTGAHADEARQFIEFALTEGYAGMLGTATEGRIPLRAGDEEGSTEYIDAWGELPFGSDEANQPILVDVYGEEIVQALVDGANSINRWGYGTGDAAVAGAMFSQHVLSQNVEPLYNGTDPADVAAQMAEAAQVVQQEVGG